MTYLLALVGLLVLAEIALRIQNPYRLWKYAFDEAAPCEPDPDRGWRPKPSQVFDYHHRYLRGLRRITQNALGLYSSREVAREKPADVYRVLVFGETTFLGWELAESETIAARLEKLVPRANGKRVEIVPIAARNYSLGQLYTWYRTVFHDFDYDLIVYNFNENNPRRSITFHESGKAPLLTQPVYEITKDDKLALRSPPAIHHRNDMAYVDADGNSVLIPGKTVATLHTKLRDRFHLYCALDDAIQGPTKLRKFRDRTEIKDIEKWRRKEDEGFPFQWRLCHRIFLEWAALVRAKGKAIVIVPNLQYYHAGENWLLTGTGHEWGFDYADIPSRKYLRKLADDTGMAFFDIYKHVYENRIDTDGFYVHPRYAYYSPKGAAFHAEAIATALREFRPEFRS
jgi:hypothetical protein